jgi:membrane fusion protein (multidrug efflux system)
MANGPADAEKSSGQGAPEDGVQKRQHDDEPDEKHDNLASHPILIVAGVTVIALLLLGGIIFWLNARNYESTDDAFIDAHMVRMAPQIAGRVTQVLVTDNQRVEAGQPLATLDSADVQTKVAQAEAQRAQAESQVDAARAQIAINSANYEQALAQVMVAEAQADNAASDLARYRALLAANPAAVAQQQLDQALAQARQTSAQRDSARRAAKARADEITAARTQVASGLDQVRAAQSQLNDANINYGYTQLVAPVAGHVAQKTVAVGAYAQAGAQLLAIVPLDVWVTANFKETQLALMRPGQKVAIKIDACPRDKIEGHVASIQRGAGQAFGLLPPENATGNFVKVVQRVPVKIVFDNPPQDCPLGPGMSVEPTVRVR